MKLKVYISALVATSSLFFFFFNKEGAGCFSKAGETKSVIVDLPTFKSIDVASNVDIELLTSGADRIEVTTGENLISGISLTVEDSVLKIENLNSCFWSRGYVNPLIAVRGATLERIIQHGYGRIFTVDTLKTDEISIQVEDASGEVDLILDANYVRVVSNNIGPITLQGKTSRLDVGIYWSDGILYASNLLVKDCRVNHNGSNRVEVNTINSINGSINSLGSVYLFGQKPSIVDITITGDGSIIEKY